MNWGECYFDHFTRHFRAPVAREVFAQDPEEHAVQVLSYDRVFEGCRMFASLGLSHYADDLGKVAEIIVPVNEGWDAVPSILANALFYMIQEQLHIGRGVAVAGLGKVDAVFSHRFGKEALYITSPYGLPTGAETVRCNGQLGSLFLGIFLAEPEYRLFLDQGADALESALEKGRVDPYHLSRAAIT